MQLNLTFDDPLVIFVFRFLSRASVVRLFFNFTTKCYQMAQCTFTISTRSARSRKVLSLLFALEDGKNIRMVDCSDHRFIQIVRGMKAPELDDIPTKWDKNRMDKATRNMDKALGRSKHDPEAGE